MEQALPAAAAFLPNWNLIVTGVVPFVIFLIAATAEMNRPPFDLTEAEQELVAGFNTEYSSIRFALFYIAEFMGTITFGAIIATLFLGGPAGPDLGVLPGWLWGSVWFFLKLAIFPFIWICVPGHAAAAPLRPADGPRLEAADPAGARLAAAHRRHPRRRRRGLRARGRRHRRRARRGRSCCPPPSTVGRSSAASSSAATEVFD